MMMMMTLLQGACQFRLVFLVLFKHQLDPSAMRDGIGLRLSTTAAPHPPSCPIHTHLITRLNPDTCRPGIVHVQCTALQSVYMHAYNTAHPSAVYEPARQDTPWHTLVLTL
jgi:hypothetical protein